MPGKTCFLSQIQHPDKTPQLPFLIKKYKKKAFDIHSSRLFSFELFLNTEMYQHNTN